MMTMRLRDVTGIALLMVFGCAASPAKKTQTSDAQGNAKSREVVIGAMKQELKRSMSKLKFKDYKAPYFMAYQLKDHKRLGLTGKYGSVVSKTDSRTRYLYTEIRVGDHSFDNYANIDNEAFRLNETPVDKRAPLDNNAMALRGVLWRMTDAAYKKALSDYLTKKGGAVYSPEKKTSLPSFSKEKMHKYRGQTQKVEFDQQTWKKHIATITKQMVKSKNVVDSSMDVSVTRVVRYLTTSTGADIIDEQVIYAIHIEAITRAKDGMKLDNGRSYYARSAAQLPSLATMQKDVAAMLTELQELRQAPVLDPYTGPAILLPAASGVLFHEAIGHRLEGERQRKEDEGQTFKGRLNKAVIPKFLSVYDDPTLDKYNNVELNGFYQYDDEGVRAQRVALIEKGVLKAYLKSRTPVDGSPHSNGHGRSQGSQKPIARMGNLMVAADKSKSVPYTKLKQMLIAEIKKQKKPFGLIIKDITGGSTNTSGYGYQAFKGSSRLIYKVDQTGKETLVRGAEMVGTPLVSINKIVAASTEMDIFNGYCGAESGYVPVSTVAPALLTTEIELQRNQAGKERAPLLPPPWKDDAKPKAKTPPNPKKK